MSAEKSSVVNGTMKNTVTKEQVLIVAQRVTNDPKVKVITYDLKDYSSTKLGFFGVHRNLNICVQKNDSKVPDKLTLFVKSVPYDSDLKPDLVRSEYFLKESYFYDTIVPWLTKDYKSEKWAAKCYLVTEDALIMEDLRLQNYKLLTKLTDDLCILKSILATLARFHSCSILTQARLVQQSMSPALNEYHEDSLVEIAFNRSRNYDEFDSVNANLATALAEYLGYDSTNILASFEHMYKIVKPSKTHYNVISHGDLWANNFMFDDSTPLRKCVFVDFQVIRYAPLVLDILQILYYTSTRKFRETNEKNLIAFYHSILEDTVRSNDPTGNAKIPKLSEIIAEYEDLSIYGAVIASLNIPSDLLIEIRDLADDISDAEDYEKFITGDKLDITLAYLEKHEIYRKRVEEVILELLEVSKRL